MNDRQIDPDLLLDYVDGTLSDLQRQQVEALLARTPGLRAEVAALQRLQRRLRGHLPSIAHTPVPSATTWRAVAQRTIHRRAAPFGQGSLIHGLVMAGVFLSITIVLTGLLRGGGLQSGTGGQPAVAEVVSTVEPTATATAVPTTAPINSPSAGQDRDTLQLRRSGPIVPAATTAPPRPAALEQSAALVNAFFDAYNRQDVAGVLAVLDPIDYTDCAEPSTAKTVIHTREALQRWLLARFAKREQLGMQQFTMQEWRADLGRPVTTDATISRSGPNGTAGPTRLVITFNQAVDRIARLEFVCAHDPAAPTPIGPGRVVQRTETDLPSLQRALPFPLWQPSTLPLGISLTAVYQLDIPDDGLGVELHYEGTGSWLRIMQSMPAGPVMLTDNPKLHPRRVVINGQPGVYFDRGGPSNVPVADRMALRWVDHGRLVEIESNLPLEELLRVAQSLAPGPAR